MQKVQNIRCLGRRSISILTGHFGSHWTVRVVLFERQLRFVSVRYLFWFEHSSLSDCFPWLTDIILQWQTRTLHEQVRRSFPLCWWSLSKNMSSQLLGLQFQQNAATLKFQAVKSNHSHAWLDLAIAVLTIRTLRDFFIFETSAGFFTIHFIIVDRPYRSTGWNQGPCSALQLTQSGGATLFLLYPLSFYSLDLFAGKVNIDGEGLILWYIRFNQSSND